MGPHPGLGGYSIGVKHAFVTSKKEISAFPPFSVPRSVERERSCAMGVRWAALARAKRGHSWSTCATVWGSVPPRCYVSSTTLRRVSGPGPGSNDPLWLHRDNINLTAQ